MKKRQRQPQEKFKIMLKEMSGNIEIAKLCAKYQICQTQYYEWRDLFLQCGHQAFEQKISLKKNSASNPKTKNSNASSAISLSS